MQPLGFRPVVRGVPVPQFGLHPGQVPHESVHALTAADLGEDNQPADALVARILDQLIGFGGKTPRFAVVTNLREFFADPDAQGAFQDSLLRAIIDEQQRREKDYYFFQGKLFPEPVYGFETISNLDFAAGFRHEPEGKLPLELHHDGRDTPLIGFLYQPSQNVEGLRLQLGDYRQYMRDRWLGWIPHDFRWDVCNPHTGQRSSHVPYGRAEAMAQKGYVIQMDQLDGVDTTQEPFLVIVNSHWKSGMMHGREGGKPLVDDLDQVSRKLRVVFVRPPAEEDEG